VSARAGSSLTALSLAVALTVPWFGVLVTDVDPGLAGQVVLSGTAILGSSFLLAWAAETAERDVPRSFAIAVLAILAVAPEYAVDAFYAWTAGAEFGTARGLEAGNLAVANMTGANRILIGIGWSGIALFTVYQATRTRDPAVESRPGLLASRIQLDRDLAIEIAFLLLATLWAFAVPLGGGIGFLDLVALVGLYVVYILIVIRAEVETEVQHVGVPAYLESFSRPRRVGTVLALFGYAGLAILLSVEPFAHGLESAGIAIGIPPFFMIQWIAPLASEAPELIVVALLVTKARSTAGFNTLISSKLNQWTLLIGTLVVVYSIALGRYGVLPFDLEQAGEIWLTAAQSYFALAILVNFWISLREAVVLLVLFVSQVLAEFLFLTVWTPIPEPKFPLLMVYTAVYMLLGTSLFLSRREHLRAILGLAGVATRRAVHGRPAPTEPPD
jgi:cation:H+ antiporter